MRPRLFCFAFSLACGKEIWKTIKAQTGNKEQYRCKGKKKNQFTLLNLQAVFVYILITQNGYFPKIWAIKSFISKNQDKVRDDRWFSEQV